MSTVDDIQGSLPVTRRNSTAWRRVAVLIVSLVAGLAGEARDAMAQPVPSERIAVRIDVGERPASRTFAGTRVFTVFSEQGSFEAAYEIEKGGIVDGGISFLLWRNLAIGLDVSSYRSINAAQVTSELPHPFFFDLPRTTSGVAGGLERQELGVHVQALWVSQLADWLVLSLSGGPSLINAQQDLVATVQHTEIGFPFDQIVFDGHTVASQSANTIGMNGGVDVDLFLLHKLPFLSGFDAMENVGLGLLLRYVRGSVEMRVGDDRVEVDLGGLQLTTGLRFRF